MERTFRTLVCTEEKGVCTLLLNAPPVNVITRALLEELDEAFQTLEFHTDLRAVVLSSALPKLFCAGADIKQFQTWTSATGSENCRFGSQVYRRIERFPRPVLCAVNGSAFGGGLNWPWPAMSAFLTSAPESRCRNVPWACSRAMAAPSACPGWWDPDLQKK